MRRLLFLTLILTAACAVENAERPKLATGTWQRTTNAGEGDTLELRADGTAQRRGARAYAATGDQYTAWRVVTDSATHRARLCLEKGGIGTASCEAVEVTADALVLGVYPAIDRFQRVKAAQ